MEALEKESCRVHEAIEVLEQRLCTVLRASAPAEAGLAGVLTNTQLGNGIASSTQRIAGASGRLADIIDRLEL
jgi:hypothetical protein